MYEKITLYTKQGVKFRQWSVWTEGAEVIVEHGQLGGKLTQKRYTAEPKNVGRANATTAEEQAIQEADAKVAKQLKTGYYYTIEEATDHVEFTPMKAQNSDDYKHKLKFPCYIQPKLNGCFGYNTRILTLDGYKTIGDIVSNKLSVKVASYNEATETVEYKKVINWFNNGLKKKEEWLLFNGKQKVTKNHKFFSGGTWVEAENIDGELFGINPKFNAIVAGMLLGDSVANMEKRRQTTGEVHSWRLSFSTSESDEKFGEGKTKLLDGISWKVGERVSGYGKPVKYFCSQALSSSPFDISIFYVTDRSSANYGRRVENIDTQRLKEIFDDETLLLWYMDDGSLHFNNGNPDTPRIFISVARYSDETIKGFVKIFTDLYKVTPNFGKYGKDKRLSFSTVDTCYLLMRLSKLAEDLCERKFPRNLKLGKMQQQSMFCNVPNTVGNTYSRGSDDSFYEAFDIEVEDNHNYFAEGVLVHNCRMMIDKDGNAWSKQGEPLEFPKHWKSVKEAAIMFGGLDGEVYAGLESEGGLSLQQIISAFRKANKDSPKLKLYVYDVPLANKPFRERAISLMQVIHEPFAEIEVVETHLVKSFEDAVKRTKEFVSLGYEGAILRNQEGMYEFGKRSYDLQKLKFRLDAEAVVVSVTQDKNGDGVLLCQAINGKQTGVQFECLMRKDADPEINYRKYSNALLLIGKAITYEYEELSDKGIPTKPVSVAVREMVGNEGRY